MGRVLTESNGWKAVVAGATDAGMSISLLKVGDHFSLEFASSDLDAVRCYIQQRDADLSSKAAGTAVVVSFGGEHFKFQNEWDDPCLISGSVKGDDLLRAIHSHFSER